MNDINLNVQKMKPFIVMEILEKAKLLEKEGKNIIHFEVGEPDFDLHQAIKEASFRAIESNATHYTHSLGDLELRNSISSYYKKKYNVKVNPNCILVTSGSSPAFLMTLLTLCNAGDEVIISNPGYPCYKNFILACNAVPIDVKVYADDNFNFNINAVRKAITSRTKAIIINSPMNPCGTLLSNEALENISNLGIKVISDEIYHELLYEGTDRSILEFNNDAFVINGFSKRYAMTGLRLGFIIAPEQYIRSLQILQQNLFICAPSTAQRAGVAALNNCDADVTNMRKVYNERRLYMTNRLINMGFEISSIPLGAFYIFANACKFTCNSYQFAIDVLNNAHVGITPGIDFGSNGEGYVRFSYANSLDNIKEGLNRLEQYLVSISRVS